MRDYQGVDGIASINSPAAGILGSTPIPDARNYPALVAGATAQRAACIMAADTMRAAPAFETKIARPDALDGRLRSLIRPLVFTNGVFDVLHRGHVTYLAEARALGASLILALNSDSSVKRLGKGPGRPVNALEDRLAVAAALESVSLVTWFEEDTPLPLILKCRPDVLVKGGDWPVDKIVGAKEVLKWGGTVHSIEFQFERSTTELLSRIRKS